MESTYTYLDSQVVDLDTMASMRNTVSTDCLASSFGIIALCLKKQLNQVIAWSA